MTFQIHPLAKDVFAHLFDMDSDQLAAHKAARMKVDAHPGFPCRISLEDAQIGETVILANYTHLPTASPYHASHAVFLRETAPQAVPLAGTIPPALLSRQISVRVFDAQDMMIAADLCDGQHLAAHLEEVFQDPSARQIHLHYAKPGCFAARATRID